MLGVVLQRVHRQGQAACRHQPRTGQERSPSNPHFYRQELKNSTNVALLGNSQYLCGDQLTIADISAFCEIIQLLFIYQELASFKNLSRWLNTVYQIPAVQDAHAFVFKAIAKFNPNPKF
jgi:glutathione S-transferase